jgi:hypothetical protein
MQQLIDLIESTNAPFELKIGSLQVSKLFTSKRSPHRAAHISARLYCQPIHLQALLDLGIKIDFSSRNNDFAPNQNHIGSGLNTLSFDMWMPHTIYAKISKYFRNQYSGDMMNNQNLSDAGFPFNERTIKKYGLSKYYPNNHS